MAYNYFLIFLSIGLLSSCQPKTPDSFYEMCAQAKQTNQYLWLNLNYGHTPLITEQIEEYKTSRQPTKENFILQQCNLLDTSNVFLNYIFLIENTNNSYIFNPQGELVAFSNNKITAESIRNQWDAIRNNRSQLPDKTREFVTTPDSLLSLYNLVLQAHLLYHRYSSRTDSLKKALQLSDQSIGIEPYFYNFYLKSKILKALKNPEAAHYARLAIQYGKNAYQKQIYAILINELSSEYPTALESGKGRMDFKKTVLNAGKLPLHSEYEFNFEFENTGEEPIVITSVSSTCGCATPEWSKKPILPCEKGEIKVRFHAEKYGNFVRSVFVQSTAQNYVEQLLLRGHVSFNHPNQ
ncbi:MAG: DUF1573 domain-containing protein [Odoribacter sp.]|nr:DUF1573 domain-containing protein [Odoribacter sp.]